MLEYFRHFLPIVAMLEFWFDPKVSPRRKFSLLLILLVIATVLYFISPLPIRSVLLFSATGVVFLICRYVQQHFFPHVRQHIWARLCHWLPIALLLAVVFSHYPHQDLLILGTQGIAIMSSSVCIFSLFLLFNHSSTDA